MLFVLSPCIFFCSLFCQAPPLAFMFHALLTHFCRLAKVDCLSHIIVIVPDECISMFSIGSHHRCWVSSFWPPSAPAMILLSIFVKTAKVSSLALRFMTSKSFSGSYHLVLSYRGCETRAGQAADIFPGTQLRTSIKKREARR